MFDRDEIYDRVEQILQRALAEKHGVSDLELRLDRETGDWQSNYEIDLKNEARIISHGATRR